MGVRDPRPAAITHPHLIPRVAPRGSSHRLATDANEFSVEVPTRVATSPERPELAFSPGQRVEHYEIIREIGHGGMGRVYMARDTRLGRVVAIKFLTNRDPELTRRFLVEAQTTARCTHENIVVIYAAATWCEHPYMALEYLEGTPLSLVIKDHGLSPARSVEIMVSVVRAVTRAHQFGIVHRDLKPENIFITQSGTVKVLDFGVAKLFGEPDEPTYAAQLEGASLYETLSTGGRVVGTLPFMAPEQFGGDTVDERADLWAIGVILFRMLSAEHPLEDPTVAALMFSARDLQTPLRSLSTVAPTVPSRLARIVDRCLRKAKPERYQTAADLLSDLEALLPARHGRRLGDDECPYPGLLAFEEDDADRFFGRSREITRAVALLRDNPLIAVVGPSGAGKSSFVRAGLIPELKSSGAAWETFIVRPGRDPLVSLAPLVEACLQQPVDGATCAAKLRAEPGYLGAILREYARVRGTRVLVLVDQFEELYTLISEESERRLVSTILHGIADDPTSPLRLVLNLRSDFLHRVVEHEDFATLVMRSLLLLGPPDRQALRDAVVSPAEKVDLRFESEAMLDEMLVELSSAVAPYPLLQFCLATLWARRDRTSRVFRHETFREIGGVAGALAAHADRVIATFSQSTRHVVRAIFQRLVTSDGTRAIVDRSELETGSENSAEVRRVLGSLVEARLLVVHDDTGTVEIVHEALITQWPTLRRWLDESREDTTFLEQVRVAARQWDSKRRSAGLLWRGPAARDAARFLERYGESALVPRERDFLREVVAGDRRSARRRRIVVGVVITVLGLAAAGSTVGFLAIRSAEREAREAADVANREAARAQSAERTVHEQLDLLTKKEAARRAAAREAEANAAAAEANAVEAARRRADAEMSREQLVAAFRKLKVALRRTEILQRRAEKSRDAAQTARQQLQSALDREKERVRKLQQQRGKIVDKL